MAFGLLGRPVAHSASPAIHRAAFAALGIDAEYEPLDVSADELVEAMRAYARTGGGNVTLPHKERAASALARPSGAVRRTGACNCFWRDEEGALAGDNTDIGGFLTAVGELLGERPLAGRSVLLFGAGGAARAVLMACLEGGARRVDIHNRTAARAGRLAREVGGTEIPVRVLEGDGLAAGPWDLAVNATSLGLHAEDATPPAAAPRATAALDLVYAPGGTRWVREARAAGIPARDGRHMLVHQAALSLRRWLPGVDPPVEAMREAAERAIGP